MDQQTIITILWTLLLLMTNAFAAVLWQKFRRIEQEVEKLEKVVNDLKFNYIARFEKATEQLHSVQLQIIERIGMLDLKLEKSFDKTNLKIKEQ